MGAKAAAPAARVAKTASFILNSILRLQQKVRENIWLDQLSDEFSIS